MKYQILRKGVSSYLKADFIRRERRILEGLKGFKFIKEKDFNPKLPLILITNSQTDVKEISKNLLTKKTLILHPNSGYDNFSYKFVKDFKGKIIIGNEIRCEAVSNYILSCFYQHSVKIPFHHTWQAARNFDRAPFSKLKILLIGHGHIGKKINTQLKSVCSVSVFDPYQKSSQIPHNKFDYIILCASLNPTSYHLINQSFIKKYFHSKTCIINPARGEVIDSFALRDFLLKNKEGWAYLDVYENEPEGMKYFKGLKNASLSSHIAGVYAGLDQALIQFEYNVLKDLIKNKNFNKRYKESLLKNKIRGTILI